MSRQNRMLRQARLERAAWSRRLAAAIAVVGFAAALPSLFSGMQNRAPAAAAKEPRLLTELREAMTRMQTALLPAQRRAAAALVARRRDEFEPLLLAILAQPNNPMFLGAAPLAAEIPLEGALEALYQALPATKGEAKSACLLAIDVLDPLAETEVEDLLKDIDDRMVRTGLQIAGRREPLPEALVEPVLETLTLGKRELRAHALTCLPAEITDAHVETVLGLVEEFPEDTGFAALLSRIAPTPRGTERLLGYLEEADEATIERLAPVLKRYASSTEIPAALWSIAMGDDPVERRASALYCLELAGVREGFPSLTENWPPLLQYHLARLRLAAGQSEGLDTLFQLASGDTSSDPELQDVAGRSRLLLGHVTGLPPHATEEDLRAWRANRTDTPAGRLPAPTR